MILKHYTHHHPDACIVSRDEWQYQSGEVVKLAVYGTEHTATCMHAHAWYHNAYIPYTVITIIYQQVNRICDNVLRRMRD
jgi:hypothetical protein